MFWILITILLLIFAVICWKKLDWALAVLVLCLPVYLVRFKIGWLPTTLLEMMVWVLIIVFLAKLLFDSVKRKSAWMRWKLLLKKWWLPILLFLIAATISVFMSDALRQASGRWKAYFIEPILVFLIFLDVVRSKKQIRMIMWALGISASLISLVAILQYIFGYNIPVAYDIPNLKRAVGFYGYPNAIGLYVAPIVVLFIGLMLGKFQVKGDSRVKNIMLCGLVVVLGVFGVIAAVSKGAWIGIAVGVFFMFMFTKWRWWIVGLGIVLVVLMFLVPITHDVVWPVITFQETSGDVRLVLWEGTWNLIKSNPIFGAGLAGFEKAYPEYKLNKHTEILVYPHNIFLNFWVEIGLLGLIAFVWMIVLYFKTGISNFKFRIPLMGAMVCLIVHGFVDVPYFKNDLAMLFWVLVGLMIVSIQIKGSICRQTGIRR